MLSRNGKWSRQVTWVLIPALDAVGITVLRTALWVKGYGRVDLQILGKRTLEEAFSCRGHCSHVQRSGSFWARTGCTYFYKRPGGDSMKMESLTYEFFSGIYIFFSVWENSSLWLICYVKWPKRTRPAFISLLVVDVSALDKEKNAKIPLPGCLQTSWWLSLHPDTCSHFWQTCASPCPKLALVHRNQSMPSCSF